MKGKLKISEQEFKNYLLESYINDKSEKVSDRELWSSPEFFEYTGMFSINKYTKERKILSTGTISYWKNKLDIKEKDVFLYHQNVTGKIGKDVDYLEWSKMNNKGHTKKRTYTNDTIKRKLIKYANLPNKYRFETFDRLQEIIFRFWNSMGLNAEEEMKKFYTQLKEGGK